MISLRIAFLIAMSAGILGVILGYILRILIALSQKGSIELNIKRMLGDAHEESKRIALIAEQEAATLLKNAREDIKEKEDIIIKNEERLIKKEEVLEKKQQDLEKEVIHIKDKVQEIKNLKERVDGMHAEKLKELEKVARLSTAEAKEQLMKQVEKDASEDLATRMFKLERNSEDVLERKANDILAVTIQRLASSVSSEMFTSHIPIEQEETKGKIIGKEGRNIKAFERETGVEVIVDDAPNAITLSSYDPIRRQIARIALENLIKDGRIQPAKIEQEVKKAKDTIDKIIKEKGEEAVYEIGILNLDPKLVQIVGRLHYRTSYGHNVLQHSVEMAHIAGMLAAELGADVKVAKAGALLHDIGKALDHEVDGTHVEIGRKILQKFNVDEAIIKAMQAHHEEYPYETIESVIVQTADAISGGRPGARKDSIENYLKRLGDLEGIATGFPGVEKAYALAAGREIRVFVTPNQVSDAEARNLARNIAMKIETELKYPGEIKVMVIRETKVLEVAR